MEQGCHDHHCNCTRQTWQQMQNPVSQFHQIRAKDIYLLRVIPIYAVYQTPCPLEDPTVQTISYYYYYHHHLHHCNNYWQCGVSFGQILMVPIYTIGPTKQPQYILFSFAFPYIFFHRSSLFVIATIAIQDTPIVTPVFNWCDEATQVQKQKETSRRVYRCPRKNEMGIVHNNIHPDQTIFFFSQNSAPRRSTGWGFWPF